MFVKFFPVLSGAFVALLLLSSLAVSQDLDYVTISGKITDANGLAVAGANVTATATLTGEKRTVATDDAGRSKIINLKPGD